ncbi:MAG: hypothetical protein R2758_03915 [Bacteroidales bacterium]
MTGISLTYSIHSTGRDLLHTPSEKEFITRAYAQCSSISVDYGIMEKADNVYVKCTDLGWSDLGTWEFTISSFRT